MSPISMSNKRCTIQWCRYVLSLTNPIQIHFIHINVKFNVRWKSGLKNSHQPAEPVEFQLIAFLAPTTANCAAFCRPTLVNRIFSLSLTGPRMAKVEKMNVRAMEMMRRALIILSITLTTDAFSLPRVFNSSVQSRSNLEGETNPNYHTDSTVSTP